MSDIKPVTEAPSTAAPTVDPIVEPTPEVKPESVDPTPAPKAEEPAQADVLESSPAVEAETEVEPPKEIEPIQEGVLETKFLSVIPIFLKKHTFYFSDEAISEDNLGEYFKKEKTKSGHATYAHATQTGKGLLFYTKTDKTKPTGIVRLDGADITTQGDKKFTIKSAGHELQLEASTPALRERWVYTLKLKITESEGVHASISETDGYNAALEKLVPKPAPVAVIAKEKKEEVVEGKKEGEEVKEETPAEPTVVAPEEEAGESSAGAVKPEEEKKEEKKRSSSKNRLNRFSFFGKKEEKKDEVKEEQPVAEVKEETAPAPEPVPVQETAAVTSEEPTTTAPPVETVQPEEPKTETSPVASPKASNRKSFLGGLFQKKKEEKKDAPVAEEGEAKSPEPIAETEAPAPAPVAAPVTTQEPDAGEQVAAVEPQATTSEPVKSDTEAESPSERKQSSSGIFGSLRRDDKQREDKPRRSLSFWKKDKEKKGKEEAQPTAITESEPQAEAATTEEPAKTEPSSVAPVIPDVTATSNESEKKITDIPTAPVVTVGDGSKA